MAKASFVFCPECGGTDVIKKNRYYENGGDKQKYEQIYKCKTCMHRFLSRPNSLKTNHRHNVHNQIGALKVKNLATATETKTVVGDKKGILVEYAWKLKKRGLKENTIKLRTFQLGQLIAKGADLNNPDSVETLLATEEFTHAKKYLLVAAYGSYTKAFKIPWEPIKTNYQPKEPWIPSRELLVAFVHGLGKSTATFCQVAMTTGARRGDFALCFTF
jgi:hypothetical protein